MSRQLLVLCGLLATIADAQTGTAKAPQKFDVSGEVEQLVNNADSGVVGFRAEYKSLRDMPTPVGPQFAQERPTEPPSTVSVQRLRHKPPKAATREFARAISEERKGKRDQSIAKLTSALKLDPEYTEARLELGTVLLEQGRMYEALDELDRGLALDPNSLLLHFDRAWVLLALNSPAEAEPEARRALQLDPRDLGARYEIGLALIAQGHLTDEVPQYLRAATPRFPGARIALDWYQKAIPTSSPR